MGDRLGVHLGVARGARCRVSDKTIELIGYSEVVKASARMMEASCNMIAAAQYFDESMTRSLDRLELLVVRFETAADRLSQEESDDGT